MGGGLDLDALDDSTFETLAKAGIDFDELLGAAGPDGVIAGHDELSRLFDLIDRFDRNGSVGSVATTRQAADGSVVTTASGELVLALRDEVDRARLGLGSPPSLPAGYQRALDALHRQGFTDVHLAAATPYFSQADQEWANHPYPKVPPEPGVTRTLHKAGCAPTALAMADVALRGKGIEPPSVADFAVEAGLSGSGTIGSNTMGMGRAWAEQHGLVFTAVTATDSSKKVDELWEGICAGGVAVVGVGPGHFTERSHVMVVNGCARDSFGQDWFFVVDPGRKDQSRRPGLNVDDTVVQDKSLDLGCGQLRISRAQLESELRHGYILSGGDQ